MKYEVAITETLRKVVSVEAASAREAKKKVGRAYADEEIVLDAQDFYDYEIEVIGQEN